MNSKDDPIGSRMRSNKNMSGTLRIKLIDYISLDLGWTKEETLRRN